MSGLILLVIVGAWLAVLVPMALRSHDAGRALSTVDKFHDAMRVLSRRDAAAGPDGPPEPPRPPSPGTPAPRPRATPAPGLSVASRRRRVLVGLAVTALALLAAGLVGPRWLLAGHALVDLLLVAYVGHLRHQTVLRHERDWRAALGERVPAARAPRANVPAARSAGASPAAASSARVLARPATRAVGTATVRHAAPGRVAGIPDRMPARELVTADAVAVEQVAVEQVPAPVRGAVGAPWAPVPVPLPGYVTAPTAPRRVLDLTRPGEWSDGVAAAERDLGIDDRGPELEDILERRRAAGDW